MSQSDNITFLYSLEKFGIKLGLQNTKFLLDYLNNPQNNFKSVHIAGTNGKGSVSSFIVSILEEEKIKTGHYTSPHLVKFNERIKVNNIEISDEQLDNYVNKLKEIIIEKRATFFEATTAMAFRHFADEQIEFGVIETGLGGRYDSTNILNPVLSIITNITIDHVQQLGTTVESIAGEKAGIIKENTPCITASDDERVLNIFEETCRQKNSKFYNVNQIFDVIDYHIERDGLSIKASDDKELYELYSPVNGKHQIKNILCAIQSIKLLNEIAGTDISKDAILNGIKNVCANTGLHCRIETFSRKPNIILDVAHNVGSIKALVETIRLFDKNKVHLVFGIMKDKDYESVIKMLSSIGDFIY